MRVKFVVLFIVSLMCGLIAAPAVHAANNRLVRPDEAPSLFTLKIPEGLYIDSIAVHKQTREMLVFSNNRLLKIYRVHLGINPVGRKQVSGDYKTPEGLYHIAYLNAQSLFHLSLGISYPNSSDAANAKRLGKQPGGDIMIHGLPNSDANAGPERYQNDWTWGCIAVRNEEVEELFMHVQPGTSIYIAP